MRVRHGEAHSTRGMSPFLGLYLYSPPASRSQFGITYAGEFSLGFNDCGLFLLGTTPVTPTYPGNCNQWEDSTNWSDATKAGLMQFALASMDASGEWFFWTWKVRRNSLTGLQTHITPVSNTDRKLHSRHRRISIMVLQTRSPERMDASRSPGRRRDMCGPRRRRDQLCRPIPGLADRRRGSGCYCRNSECPVPLATDVDFWRRRCQFVAELYGDGGHCVVAPADADAESV